MVRIAILVLVLTSSCTRHVVVVRPSELARNAGELVRRGEATVFDARGASVRVTASDVIDVQLADGDTQRPARLTVREVVAGCVDDVDSSSCVARQAVDRPITMRRDYRTSQSRVATGLAFGVMGGVIGICLVQCQGSAELREDLAYGGLGVVGALAVFTLLMVLGGSD